MPQPAAPCLPSGVTDPQGKSAFTLRFGTATAEAVKTGSVTHPANTDLTNFPDGLGTFTKALKQTSPAIVDAGTLAAFLKACGIAPGTPGNFEDPAIKMEHTGTPYGKLNGPRGAFAWQQAGKDFLGLQHAAGAAGARARLGRLRDRTG